jgi:hypothetical protein
MSQSPNRGSVMDDMYELLEELEAPRGDVGSTTNPHGDPSGAPANAPQNADPEISYSFGQGIEDQVSAIVEDQVSAFLQGVEDQFSALGRDIEDQVSAFGQASPRSLPRESSNHTIEVFRFGGGIGDTLSPQLVALIYAEIRQQQAFCMTRTGRGQTYRCDIPEYNDERPPRSRLGQLRRRGPVIPPRVDRPHLYE